VWSPYTIVQVDPDGTVTVTPDAIVKGPNVPELLLEEPVSVVDATVWDCVTVYTVGLVTTETYVPEVTPVPVINMPTMNGPPAVNVNVVPEIDPVPVTVEDGIV
jgi:hypothetical protein